METNNYKDGDRHRQIQIQTKADIQRHKQFQINNYKNGYIQTIAEMETYRDKQRQKTNKAQARTGEDRETN